jgi:protein-disulfide isomerase-like protein with CxxC motif
MTTEFAVSWDYRCPFARNAHEHLVEGLRTGADWDVTFVPFSLNQVHVTDHGDPDVWDDPSKAAALLAMEVGIVVRDRFPEQFLDVHAALFKARHEEGRDIREESILREILTEQGVDADTVFTEIADGWPVEQFRKEHEAAAGDHKVWGVPTFIVGDGSVFVRLMTRPAGDGELATRTIQRVVDLVSGFPELNEFKHTSIAR